MSTTADDLADTLERLAAQVREHPPAAVDVNFRRRTVELPGEGGWVEHEDGGLERVTVDVRW